MTEWDLNPVVSYPLAIGASLALLAVFTLVRLACDRLAPGKRAALLGLRLAVFALMLAALFRPSLVQIETKKQSSTLVLLADRSRSMQVADAFGGRTRWQALGETLSAAAGTLADLASQIEVKAYAFDAQAAPLELAGGQIQLGARPDGRQTAIGAALEEVLRREAGKRLSGVILLSDGAQRAYAPHDAAPQTPARRLADLGTPLYTFTFGQARGQSQSRDVALRDLLVNPTVYVKNRLTVGGTARLAGFANQQLVAQLLVESAAGKMEVVGSVPLRTSRDDDSLSFELSYLPQTPGERKLTVAVAQQPGETLTTNNQLSTFVSVVEGGLNVVYLDGSPGPEQKYLRWSLDASDDIALDYHALAERDPGRRAGDLAGLLQRGKCDAVLLGNVDASQLKPAELEALAKFVRDGGGLAMLGGFHAFGPGGFADTPLAAVAPMEMQAIERQGFDEAVRSDVHLPGPLTIRPAAPHGARHYLTALAESDNAAAWERLPPLEGANKLLAPKPSARVLLETQAGQPLLVVHEAGGRVAALAVDSTWRWWRRGFEREHKRFWRQLVLWLARKDESTRDRVWVKLPQRRFPPGARLEFNVGANTTAGEPIRDATFRVQLIQPSGQRASVPVARQGDSFTAAVSDTQVDGDYTIEVTAEQNGQSLGSGKARFLIFKQDLEMDNAAADPTLLASLAKMTERFGGQSLAPEELPALLERIAKQPTEVDVKTQVKHVPWNTWPFFLALVGLLCVEWALRKRWGLV